jgi:hypothetical protein
MIKYPDRAGMSTGLNEHNGSLMMDWAERLKFPGGLKIIADHSEVAFLVPTLDRKVYTFRELVLPA